MAFAAALALSLLIRDSSHGDSTQVSDAPLKPRLLFVDADHPATWPQGLEPIPAGELRQLLSADKETSHEPPGGQIEQAVYRATFRDGSLTQGDADVRLSPADRPTLVPLERSGAEAAHPIDFSRLRWVDAAQGKSVSPDKPAAPAKDAVLCGIDRSGRRVIVAEPGRSRLSGEWSLAGRPTLGGADFTISLPPAVISQLVLSVPTGFSVECDQGVLICPRKEVESTGAPVAGAVAVWRLELGSRSSCRLRIVAKSTAASRRVLYDEDTTFVLAADRLRLTSKLQLEVFGSPLHTLKLAVPAGLRVETITYGDDFPLAVPANSPDSPRELSLELPEPLLGKGRTIAVEASAATRTRQLWNLPQVAVPGAVLRDGQAQLTVRPPLKLVRFGGESGLAQSEAPTYSIDGEETFLLRQNAYDPALAIEVAEPSPALSARTLARLDLRPDQCLLAADVVCTASGGSVFSVAFELPQSWDVTRVESVGDPSRMIDETTRTVGDRKRVKIDFFRAVTDREPKRFRVTASRSLPRSGESIDVPVIDFPGFASQEVETLVLHGSSIELATSPADAFAAFDPAAILSVLADSPLRPDRKAVGETQMLAHRWTGQNSKARITLRRGEALQAARVQTSIDVNSAQQLSEQIDATIVPASPVDRVLVYLSAEGPQFSWSVVTDQKKLLLEGARLAAARHAEWDLPEVGELWEIRLPEPLGKEFHLAGTRHSRALGGSRIGVAFIPGAASFEGTIQLHLEEPEQFEIETRESHAHLIELGGHARDDRRSLRETTSPAPSGQSQSPASGAGSAKSATHKNSGLRVFHYDRAADVLFVRPKSSAVVKGGSRFVSLAITSFLSGGATDDLHRAEFSVAPELSPQPFRFRIDSGCRLGFVAVNGRLVRVQRHGEEVTVPALPADAWNRVHVEYKTAAASRLFRETRPIEVPRADADVLSFRWRVYLAPGLQPGAPPSGVRFEEGPPSFSWAERLFGPLGRSAAQMRLSSFKADAWIVDLTVDDPEPEGWTPTDREPAPAGWSIWDASAEELPTSLSLTIWHMSKFRTLAWIVCLGCLSIGLALAQLAPRVARRLGLFALAAAAALAVAAPVPYALLAGACVSGTLIALLLSRPWTRVSASSASSDPRSTRPGSTVSYELRTVSALLVLAALGTMVAFAQETSPPVPRGAQTAQSTSDTRRPAAVTELLVVVPVHAGRGVNARATTLPADDELVYVEPAALAALRRRAAETERNAGVVFLSSDYLVALDERQPATIEAKYHVAVMPGPVHSLWLRLKDVTLAGANACRVNGQPAPIRQEASGFVLTLDGTIPSSQPASASSQLPSTSGARRAIAAERPSSSTRTAALPVASAEPQIYEIQLACFPTGDAKPGQFAFRVPETTRTSVRVERSGPWPMVTVDTAEGLSRQVRAGDPAIAVGQTDRLRIQAGPAPDAVPVPLPAQAVQFWRLSPGLIEMDCRVTYDRENGGSDKFTWLVPAGVTVRTTGDASRAALRTAADKSPQPAGPSAAQSGRTDGDAKSNSDPLVPLDFDCSRAPDGPITLAATLLLPLDSRNSASGAPPFSVRLPRFDVTGPEEPAVALTTNQIGISAAPGFRVTASTTDPNLSHTTKADSAFRQEAFGARKEPELIFDCQGWSALSLQLAAVIPAHKVRLMAHEARILADRIQWQTTAEIRTENAPAFVHVLRVDRRLKIDSISVREDDVERLVRFSQSGDEVTLFLRDRAAATQDLVLTGHMPLELGQPFKLPSVSLVHAVVGDVRLTIVHDPEFDVVMSNTPGVIRANDARRDARQRIAETGSPDRVEYSLSAQAAMPEIRVTRRPTTLKTGADVAKDSRAKSPKISAASPEPSAKSTSTAAIATKGPSPFASVTSNSTAPNSTANKSGDQKLRVEVLANLELRRNGLAVGSTHVLLERFPEPSLRLSWPENVVLRGALLDGHPVQPMMGSGWISLAIPSELAPHHVAVFWETREASALPAIGRVREQLPVPNDGLVTSVLLSATAPPDYRLLAPAHLAPMEPGAFARLADVVQSSAQSLSEGGRSPALRINSAEGTADNRVIGRLGIGPAEAQFSTWAIDTAWLRLPLAAAIFALVAVTALRPLSAKLGLWLADHPPLTLAVVGLVWWWCLAPRVVGPLVLVTALVWLAVQMRRKSTVTAALPSTLHLPTGSGVR